MVYEKVEIDLNKNIKKALIGGSSVLTEFLSGKTESTAEAEEINKKKAKVVPIDGYGHAAVETLEGTLALSAGLFSKEEHKEIINVNKYCGRD